MYKKVITHIIKFSLFVNKIFIVLLLLNNTIVYAKIGDHYFCEDKQGDLTTKSKFTLFWSPDGYIFQNFFENNDLSGVKSREKIIFQNENSFVSYEEYKHGISTMSFFESSDKLVTIRTFIEKDYTFSQKSECFKQ